MIPTRPFGWLGIVRLGLAQAALGAIVVLTTSTLNRVMIVELALPAALPGALVALHYALQMLRPRMGHGSDVGGRRTPWIIGGIAVLAVGGVAAAAATALMATHLAAGIVLGVAAFALIGLGAGAGGTSLLVLLAVRVPPARKAAAASIVWLMMIAGFAVTAGTAGHFLDPFSQARLLTVTSVVCGVAVLMASLAVWGVEGETAPSTPSAAARLPFRAALAQVWAEPQARRFTLFVFVSMLAYNAQELILEPFAGAVFHLTPGGSTRLGGGLARPGRGRLPRTGVAAASELFPAGCRERRVRRRRRLTDDGAGRRRARRTGWRADGHLGRRPGGGVRRGRACGHGRRRPRPDAAGWDSAWLCRGVRQRGGVVSHCRLDGGAPRPPLWPTRRRQAAASGLLSTTR
jgi:MFS family permease